MPPYILDSEDYIEASVKAVYTFEKLAKGTVHLRWYAKVDDRHSSLYNDSVLYRKGIDVCTSFLFDRQIYLFIFKIIFDPYTVYLLIIDFLDSIH